MNCLSNREIKNTTEKNEKIQDRGNKLSVESRKNGKIAFKASDIPASSFAGHKNPLLCCEPQLSGVTNVSLPSSTSIAVVTVAVEGQDSTIAELLRRAAGPRHGRTYSGKACHQAA